MEVLATYCDFADLEYGLGITKEAVNPVRWVSEALRIDVRDGPPEGGFRNVVASVEFEVACDADAVFDGAAVDGGGFEAPVFGGFDEVDFVVELFDFFHKWVVGASIPVNVHPEGDFLLATAHLTERSFGGFHWGGIQTVISGASSRLATAS